MLPSRNSSQLHRFITLRDILIISLKLTAIDNIIRIRFVNGLYSCILLQCNFKLRVEEKEQTVKLNEMKVSDNIIMRLSFVRKHIF